MRERISMKSKMLGALALLTLIGALFVMQSVGTSPPTADAAHGSIAAMNVGTCLTTDGDVFKGDCSLTEDASEATTGEAWEVREKIGEVSTLYATYAYDPKTASNEPRVILTDSDLLKISISDTGRDRRDGVLIGSDATNNPLVTTADPIETTDLGGVIKDDLDDLDFPDETDEIEYTDNDFAFAIAKPSPDNIIDSSGNHTLNFTRSNTNPDFHPGDFNVDSGAVVRFYGCVAATGDSACNTIVDTATAGHEDDDIKPLGNYLTVDEDTSNGEASGDTAPWLGINASVPSAKKLIILAIYYRTSDMENLVGGQTLRECSDESAPTEDNDVWSCAGTATLSENGDPDDVLFTEKESDGNSALVVRANSDGDQQSVNLFLTETGRFDGRYDGYIRLTDANGDGSVKDDPDTTADETKARDDWGREIKNGETDNSQENAAVLGVESGPVTIEYRDSDGNTQRLRIEIDTQAPTIQVTSPAHGSAGDDYSPDFNGSLEDTDSGLAAESFRLVVDNEVDNDGKNSDFALDAIPGMAPTADGVTTDQDDGISHAGDITGFASGDLVIGEAAAAELYDLGDDSCDNQNICHILADEYDDGDNNGTFSDRLRLDLQDGGADAVTRDAEYDVDFQAFVMDMAGNIGFSDSDGSNPRFINDLSSKDGDRKVPNVFGYYSAHIITIDEKDPVVSGDDSATGFYGLDGDGDPVADRGGVMVVFDGPIASSSVSTDTFAVELDDESAAQVIDVDVSKNYVFLKLANELASDATPMVTINEGESVEDRAGNQAFVNDFDEIELNDGITPKLTVTLSGGSGTGTGNEAPEKLTRDKITVHVAADEPLQGSPRIAVVCSSLSWTSGANDAINHDIDDFVANRDRSIDGSSAPTDGDPAPAYTCGYDADDNNMDDNFLWNDVASLSRPGENWEHTWTHDSAAGERFLADGSLTAVAFARDRSRYGGGTQKTNWGAASASFTLDTELLAPTDAKGGDLQPDDGDKVKETRPFVLIEFSEGTTVTLDSVELDDVEISEQFEMPDANRFVYWPASISQGEHEVEVEASDAAGNEVAFDYEFEVADRGDFVINLLAGWNAISVPADPIDTAIGSVFTDPSIKTVIGWDTQGWRIAVRRDGVWESNDQYGTLNDIRAKYGYWVKSDSFVRQPVALRGAISRGEGGNPTLTAIDTAPGWNFVGVIDQDGDQTEDDFGNSLLDSDGTPVSPAVYLGKDYVRAYTWDATFSRFDVLREDGELLIGDGVWVYYDKGIAP